MAKKGQLKGIINNRFESILHCGGLYDAATAVTDLQFCYMYHVIIHTKIIDAKIGCQNVTRAASRTLTVCNRNYCFGKKNDFIDIVFKITA